MSSLLSALARGIFVGSLLLLPACASVREPKAAIAPSLPAPAAPEVTPVPAPNPSPEPASPQKSEKSSDTSPPQSASAPEASSIKPTLWAKERMAGFSIDGRHFLYLESSRDTGAGVPKSKLQVVQVASNTCLESACLTTHYGEADANLPLSSAEESLLKQTWQVRQDLKLTPPVPGVALPIRTRSRQPDGTEQVTVRLGNRDLQLRLQQKRVVSQRNGGTAERDRAAMHLEVQDGAQRRSLDSLNNFRENVLDYSIREVKLSPDGKRLAILLTATTPTFEGTLGTTLVQGLEL